MNLAVSQLHYTILSEIVANGYAPTVDNLAAIFQRSKDDTIKCLKDLEEYHGVVLHPKTSEVWIIHPFSLSPTNFWVKSSKGQWWGNCAWCSLGIASIIKEDVTITTTLGGENKQITFQIKDGKILSDQPLFIHFPIPMKNAWDNVILTCSVMLVFSSEEEIEHWCQHHHYPKGDVQTIENIWNFAKVWYGNHLDQHWTKWTNEQAKDLFQQFNLTHDIWKIPDTKKTF